MTHPDPFIDPWGAVVCERGTDGAVLDRRYRVGRRIGSGGMGTVHEGRDLRLGISVAIKMIRAEHADDRNARRRFLREARVAARIAHRNVVRVLDYGITEGHSYIVMEWLRGEDLARLLAREAPLPWSRARELLLQSVQGLRAVHSIGVLHRDIKPSNLFAAQPIAQTSDGAPTIKLLDFGIAKSFDASSSLGSSLTLVDEVVGTPRYLAPERVRGEPASMASDIYALGLIAFEMLTGQVPLGADRVPDMLQRRMMEPAPSVRALVPTLPREVDELVRRAMATDPRRRIGSLLELERTLHASPEGDGPRAPRPPRSHPRPEDLATMVDVSRVPGEPAHRPSRPLHLLPRDSRLPPPTVSVVRRGLIPPPEHAAGTTRISPPPPPRWR